MPDADYINRHAYDAIQRNQAFAAQAQQSMYQRMAHSQSVGLGTNLAMQAGTMALGNALSAAQMGVAGASAGFGGLPQIFGPGQIGPAGGMTFPQALAIAGPGGVPGPLALAAAPLAFLAGPYAASRLYMTGPQARELAGGYVRARGQDITERLTGLRFFDPFGLHTRMRLMAGTEVTTGGYQAQAMDAVAMMTRQMTGGMMGVEASEFGTGFRPEMAARTAERMLELMDPIAQRTGFTGEQMLSLLTSVGPMMTPREAARLAEQGRGDPEALTEIVAQAAVGPGGRLERYIEIGQQLGLQQEQIVEYVKIMSTLSENVEELEGIPRQAAELQRTVGLFRQATAQAVAGGRQLAQQALIPFAAGQDLAITMAAQAQRGITAGVIPAEYYLQYGGRETAAAGLGVAMAGQNVAQVMGGDPQAQMLQLLAFNNPAAMNQFLVGRTGMMQMFGQLGGGVAADPFSVLGAQQDRGARAAAVRNLDIFQLSMASQIGEQMGLRGRNLDYYITAQFGQMRGLDPVTAGIQRRSLEAEIAITAEQQGLDVAGARTFMMFERGIGQYPEIRDVMGRVGISSADMFGRLREAGIDPAAAGFAEMAAIARAPARQMTREAREEKARLTGQWYYTYEGQRVYYASDKSLWNAVDRAERRQASIEGDINLEIQGARDALGVSTSGVGIFDMDAQLTGKFGRLARAGTGKLGFARANLADVRRIVGGNLLGMDPGRLRRLVAASMPGTEIPIEATPQQLSEILQEGGQLAGNEVLNTLMTALLMDRSKEIDAGGPPKGTQGHPFFVRIVGPGGGGGFLP